MLVSRFVPFSYTLAIARKLGTLTEGSWFKFGLRVTPEAVATYRDEFGFNRGILVLASLQPQIGGGIRFRRIRGWRFSNFGKVWAWESVEIFRRGLECELVGRNDVGDLWFCYLEMVTSLSKYVCFTNYSDIWKAICFPRTSSSHAWKIYVRAALKEEASAPKQASGWHYLSSLDIHLARQKFSLG